MLSDHSPASRRQAEYREVLSMDCALWNLTCIVRAGRYFVWRLLLLIGPHDSHGQIHQRDMVSLDREFHTNLLFMKWVIDHDLLQAGEAPRAPCYSALKCPAKRHHLSDASFEAVGGYCIGRSVYWRYELREELTAKFNARPKSAKPVPSRSICSDPSGWL